MSISLPEVTVVGTLTADPEMRFIASGKAVATVNIACNTRKKDESGEWVNGDTTFLRGSVWGLYAENVAESLSKGDKVIARGVLKQNSYEKDGEKRTTFELQIEEIGPTLRWVTAPPVKEGRSGGGAPSDGWGDSGPGW